jgi:hypothetical protein
MACYGDSFTFLYVTDIRTRRETRLWASAACYKDNVALVYVGDVRIPQEALASAALLHVTFSRLCSLFPCVTYGVN